ncbi:MAG: ATP-dependent Clp protease adaptor ClpS [Deltaproteobacteria bacterium]|nr:ATP-dependent Clp protease adaptor ClpS [Deltaproteobacteria bacterium]|tara:strand:+ start:34601 stop:34954 length:354 start_codon:yes stop_codon:yes gene_type:complete
MQMASGGKKDNNRRDGERKEGIGVLEREKVNTKRPKLYRVILHNDDYTTQEFVTHVLVLFFHKSPTEAAHLMLQAHMTGIATIGVYTKDIAESKVNKVMDYARENEHPLLLSMEPDE